MTLAKIGRWFSPIGDVLYVTDAGDMGNGFHGPWVKYRFPHESDAEAKAVLWMNFNALVTQYGFQHDSQVK